MITRSRSGGKADNMSLQEVLNRLDQMQIDINTVKTDVSQIPAINERMTSIETRLQSMESMKADVTALQHNYDGLNDKVNRLQTQVTSVTTVEQQYKDALKKLEVQKVLTELLNKRWNIIIHGIDQNLNNDGSNKWESRPDCLTKVQHFLRDVLLIDSDKVEEIVITDAHRQSVKNPKPGRPLPLIFKLGSLIDKKVIYDHLSNLSTFNAERNDRQKVWVVMQHLPEEMRNDHKSLLTIFKEAKKNKPNEKRVWFADRESAEYCLKVGNTVYKPKR